MGGTMFRAARTAVGFAFLFCALAAAGGCRADLPAGESRLERDEFVVAKDQSYVQIQTLEGRVNSAADIADLSSGTFTFDPSDETLVVLEAWVQQPDGTRIEVPAGNIFTRPSEAARSTPGFVATETTTIEFPAVQVGSIVHCKFKHTATKPDVFGFNLTILMGLASDTRREVRIQAPDDLALDYRQRGGFSVSDTKSDGIRVIEASIDTGRMPHVEPQMVSPQDVGPAFIASTLGSYERMGAIYAAQSAGKAVVTPEIVALAKRVVGPATGQDAARAIYDWVAEHIRYVAVYLDPSEAFVPHDAATVLRNGYGDCKDHVVLMQALLSVVGIRAEAALVDWSNRMTPPPLWTMGVMNHVLVYLPDFDIYANPTSPFTSFGVLDNLLSDKQAIIATANGEVRRTPALIAAASTYRSSAAIDVAADGTVQGRVNIVMSPAVDPLVRQMLASASAAEVARMNLISTQEGGFGDMKMTDPRDLSRKLQVDGRWTSPHGVVVSAPSTYMIVPLGIDLTPNGNLRGYLTQDGTRSFPFMVTPRDNESRYHVTLPEGSVVERLPPAVDIRNAAGHFTARYELTADGFTAVRRVVMGRNVYAPELYPDLAQLIYAIGSDQRATIVYRPVPKDG